LPISFSGSLTRSVLRLDFEGFAERFALAEARTTFFGAALLAARLRADLEILRADRVLCAADFFAEPFFFFGLAITLCVPLIWAPKNGRLIKNISSVAQGDLPKNIGKWLAGSARCVDRAEPSGASAASLQMVQELALE